jgi:hypothetical protein
MLLETKIYWLTDWLTDRQSPCDFDVDFELTVHLEYVVQRDCYDYCVKIGYQETSGEDRGLLCELWLQFIWSVWFSGTVVVACGDDL